MAERSKALRSGRSPLLWACSNPTSDNVFLFSHFLRLKTKCKGKLFCVSGWQSRSKALRSGRSPLLWAWSFFELKTQGKAILRVRMAEPSKALRSGRSPLLWAWVPKTKCKGMLSHVSGWPSGLRRCNQVAVHLRVRGPTPTSSNYI
ncbi:hypothetical protein TNCV_4801581 [Trichonephila clavipes]|nr:hypothetical protein TNCV_4801581 [Trichonephila clavipes]